MERTFLLKVSYKEWRSGQPLKEVYPLLCEKMITVLHIPENTE